MNRPGNLRVEIEVTTAASGDVGLQALQSLELLPWGAVGWWWARKLSRWGQFAWGLVLVQPFLDFYSSELHFSHPCAVWTISCLASAKVVCIISFTTDFSVTASW